MWRRKSQSEAPVAEAARPATVSPEILAQIRRLHFQSRRLANESVAGSYRSAFRGRGIEFEEAREYTDADDVRAIDWKVTARSGKPFVKSYREERELTVLIAVDVSASALTGTRQQLRDDIAAQAGAILTLIGMRNGDKVGLVTFSDRAEHYFPPKKARSSVWRILHEVLTPGPYHGATDLSVVLTFLSQVLKRRAVVFLISDFICPPFEPALSRLAQRHDVTALWLRDPGDAELPEATLLTLRDAESGAAHIVDTGSAAVRDAYRNAAAERQANLLSTLRRSGVGCVELWTNKPVVPPLKQFLFSRKQKARPQRTVAGAHRSGA